jgi:hypothetical protein
MKSFQEFILEASCNGSPKGMDCPSHGKEKCPKVKSHSTVEAIATKHRLDVSFIANQLKMGIPIEHEHTKDKSLATDIALQHLDEIPDYYTRLKKMEASAKKEHKKFKDVKETVTIEDANGNTFLEIIDLIEPERMKGVSEERKSGDYSLHDWFSKSKSSDHHRCILDSPHNRLTTYGRFTTDHHGHYFYSANSGTIIGRMQITHY